MPNRRRGPVKGGKRGIPGGKSVVVDNISLLCLIIDGGEGKAVRGKVRLQKVAYFCQYLGWSLRDYRLHYYGPFSQALADTIVDAEASGLINPGKEEPRMFRLTDYGREIMELFAENACEQDRVDKTRRLAQRLSDWSREELELAATIDYVANGSRMTKDALLDKVDAIKPAYARDSIAQAHSRWKRLVRAENLSIESVRR